jgi:hypothetical protein
MIMIYTMKLVYVFERFVMMDKELRCKKYDV